MSDFRTDLKNPLANAVLTVLRELGVQIVYNGSTLYADFQGRRMSQSGVSSTESEDTDAIFTIPYQVGFTGDPSSGDEIELAGHSYFIESWEVDAVGAVFTIQAKRMRATGLGKGSK